MVWWAIIFAKYGDLVAAPLTLEVENSRIRSMRSENKKLLEEFRAYTSTDENSNRVGEFAIGTNTACTHVIGNILQDEKIPGVHLAFGHPYAEHTGANWLSKTHIDCVGRDFDIWFDGEQVMRGGKFLAVISAASVARAGSLVPIRRSKATRFALLDVIPISSFCETFVISHFKAMHPELRSRFNADFTQEKYANLLRCVNETEKWPADFRISETPIFLTREFCDEVIGAANEIVAKTRTPEFGRHAASAIPSGLEVPNETAHPNFLVVDFGICTLGNRLVPRLIELQAFPSLFGFQLLLLGCMRKAYPAIPATLDLFVRRNAGRRLSQTLASKTFSATPGRIMLSCSRSNLKNKRHE